MKIQDIWLKNLKRSLMKKMNLKFRKKWFGSRRNISQITITSSINTWKTETSTISKFSNQLWTRCRKINVKTKDNSSPTFNARNRYATIIRAIPSKVTKNQKYMEHIRNPLVNHLTCLYFKEVLVMIAWILRMKRAFWRIVLIRLDQLHLVMERLIIPSTKVKPQQAWEHMGTASPPRDHPLIILQRLCLLLQAPPILAPEATSELLLSQSTRVLWT